MRKSGAYRSVEPLKKALSMLTKDEMQSWLRSIWTDLPGASTAKHNHPAPFPVELAERLINLFSFAGDTVLDPFVGIASTSIAALKCGRNSVGIEAEPAYLKSARRNLEAVSRLRRMAGAIYSELVFD